MELHFLALIFIFPSFVSSSFLFQVFIACFVFLLHFFFIYSHLPLLLLSTFFFFHSIFKENLFKSFFPFLWYHFSSFIPPFSYLIHGEKTNKNMISKHYDAIYNFFIPFKAFSLLWQFPLLHFSAFKPFRLLITITL